MSASATQGGHKEFAQSHKRDKSFQSNGKTQKNERFSIQSQKSITGRRQEVQTVLSLVGIIKILHKSPSRLHVAAD